MSVDWTKLEFTGLWADAEAEYRKPGRYYHNIDHIRRMYFHAVKFGFEYDRDLDVAILCHDVIYDADPDKEARSAEWAYEHIHKWHWGWTGKIEQLILSTEDHEVELYRDNRLIMLDLADLADPIRRAFNYELIKAESMHLYGITDKQFAAANREFMKNLARNFTPEAVNGIGYYDFWDKILEGIWYTVECSEKILAKG